MQVHFVLNRALADIYTGVRHSLLLSYLLLITLRACTRDKVISCVDPSVCRLSAQKLPDPKIQVS